MFSSRALRWALAVSLCLHLLALLAGHGWAWLSEAPPEEVTISARLLPPPLPPPTPVSRPVVPKPQPKAIAPGSAVPGSASSMSTEGGNTQSATTPGSDVVVASGAESPVPLARVLPASGRMRFAVSKGDSGFVVGRAIHSWQLVGDRYEIRSRMETVGLVALFADIRLEQFSSGHVGAEGLRPDTFRDNRKDGEYRSEFDWDRRILRLSNGTELPLAAGAQDLLSMFYQFALYPLDGPEVALMVTTGRKFERYAFSIRADEPLQLNARTDEAPIMTYHLTYRGREAEGVEVWLARDFDRLPVKIRYTDRKGGMTELLAEEINYPGKP